MSDLTGTTSSGCEILVAGAPLDPLVSMYLDLVEVDSTMFVPSQFKITFRSDPETVLMEGGLQLAVPVVITAPSDGAPTPIITGEITSVEVEGDALGISTVVRGMDMSNRLMRGKKTMAYPEMMSAEVVTTLLGEAAVIPGMIIPTDTLYPVLTQANMSSWEFIQQLARLENYVAYTDPMGLFNFMPMPKPEEGEPPSMSYDVPAMPGQLVMGQNLRRFRAVVNSAEQVPTVMVTGWDPSIAMPVVGPGPALPSTSVLLDPATEPAVVGGEFAATPYFDATRPFTDEGAATTYAMSLAADIAGALAEVEAECDGTPSITAGSVISLGMVGPPFEGNYVVTAARHVFDPDDMGYVTWVTVGGRRDRSTLALASGGSPPDPGPTISGVVTAVVMDVEDPLQLGRVKLMFPWLDPAYISDFARVMSIGASKMGTGFQWFPNPGDEVLVAFDRGCIDYPYVIGGVYNGIDMPIPPPEFAPVLAQRRFISGLGHSISFGDSPESNGVIIGTTPVDAPPLSIKLDADEMQITIDSTGMVTISGVGPVSISSEASMTITAPDLTIGDEKCVSLTLGGTTISMGSEAASIAVGGGTTAEVTVGGAMISLGGA